MSKERPVPANAEWQYFGDDSWVFGEKVRGIVRTKFGEIYFDEELDGREGGWVWMTHRRLESGECLPSPRGRALSRTDAIYFVEEALGVVPRDGA